MRRTSLPNSAARGSGCSLRRRPSGAQRVLSCLHPFPRVLRARFLPPEGTGAAARAAPRCAPSACSLENQTVTRFTLKAALLFVENPVRLKFGDAAWRMDQTLWGVLLLLLTINGFPLLFAFKEPYGGLVWVT